jgi:dihydrofolate reductase
MNKNMMMSLIVATSRNGIIGKDNDIPWKMPSDMEHFKSYTMGKTLLMGRKTFESIPGLLQGRTTIVLTSDGAAVQARVTAWKEKHPNKTVPTIVAVTSIPELFHDGFLEDTEELVICGGGKVYEQLYQYVDKFIHTLVDVKMVGTTTFMPNVQIDFTNDWIREDKESMPETRGELIRGKGDEYKYYIGTYYRPFFENVYSFETQKQLGKIEQLRLSFPL